MLRVRSDKAAERLIVTDDELGRGRADTGHDACASGSQALRELPVSRGTENCHPLALKRSGCGRFRSLGAAGVVR